MPRQARAFTQGEFYHILSRGNNRQRLFASDGDRQFYLDKLLRYKGRLGVSIFHYCLMDNHTHMLMRSDQTRDGISRLMSSLQTSYAIYFQKKNVATGHVFENRFRSLHIGNDAYLLECGRYIERNPVRAGLVGKPEQYRWSSYRFYAEGKQDLLITASPLYLLMGQSTEEREQAYNSYVATERAYETLLDKYFEERVLI